MGVNFNSYQMMSFLKVLSLNPINSLLIIRIWNIAQRFFSFFFFFLNWWSEGEIFGILISILVTRLPNLSIDAILHFAFHTHLQFFVYTLFYILNRVCIYNLRVCNTIFHGVCWNSHFQSMYSNACLNWERKIWLWKFDVLST